MQFARKYKAAMVQLRAKELQNRELMKALDVRTEELQAVRARWLCGAIWGQRRCG
jgi:hypothetical protein